MDEHILRWFEHGDMELTTVAAEVKAFAPLQELRKNLEEND